MIFFWFLRDLVGYSLRSVRRELEVLVHISLRFCLDPCYPTIRNRKSNFSSTRNFICDFKANGFSAKLQIEVNNDLACSYVTKRNNSGKEIIFSLFLSHILTREKRENLFTSVIPNLCNVIEPFKKNILHPLQCHVSGRLKKTIDISRYLSCDTGNEVFGRKPGQSILFTNGAR